MWLRIRSRLCDATSPTHRSTLLETLYQFLWNLLAAGVVHHLPNRDAASRAARVEAGLAVPIEPRKVVQLSLSDRPPVGKAKGVQVDCTYDTEGKMKSVAYGKTYTCSFDTMGRPVGMTGSSSNTWVRNVTYGPAGEMTYMEYLQEAGGAFWRQETRRYNERLQLTHHPITRDGSPNLEYEYLYNEGANAGRVARINEGISGEDVVYQYDNLNRLIRAETTATSTIDWGQHYHYDGFGNLRRKEAVKGAATPDTDWINVDADNQMTDPGYGYDLNGNLTTMPGPGGCSMTLTYRPLQPRLHRRRQRHLRRRRLRLRPRRPPRLETLRLRYHRRALLPLRHHRQPAPGIRAQRHLRQRPPTHPHLPLLREQTHRGHRLVRRTERLDRHRPPRQRRPPRRKPDPVLPLRRRTHLDAQRPPQIRHLLPRHHLRAGLCA